LLCGRRQNLLNRLGAVWYVALAVEEVVYQLEESLQLLEPAEHSLVNCCVPLAVSPVSRGLLSLPLFVGPEWGL